MPQVFEVPYVMIAAPGAWVTDSLEPYTFLEHSFMPGKVDKPIHYTLIRAIAAVLFL